MWKYQELKELVEDKGHHGFPALLKLSSLGKPVNLGKPSTLALASKAHLSCEQQVDDEVNGQQNVSRNLFAFTSWEETSNKKGPR